MEISDQEYHHKEGRSKEPKGRDAVRGTRDGYMMPATEQYSDEFQMAERRVYRRRPGFSYESAKDERKDEYSSDEEILDENVPSLVHQPDRPGQHRNIAKQRVYDENARPGIPSIRRRPARFKFDDDEEEDEEEYVPIRTPRKQKTDQNTPNHYDDDRRGGQKSPNINQEFCRRRNYSLRDRHHGFSFPKDVPRQRNYFPNEAPVYRRPPRDQRRVRGPQSLSELSIREDPRKHRVQANDFISDEDDDNSEYEEIRGQKHKFSGIRREHPDNARLLKGHWIYSEASTPGNEDYSDESEDERDVMHAGPEPVVPQEIKLTPGKLISVLAKKRDLRATLLQLLEYHHMKTHLVRRIVLANPHLFKMAGEIIEIRLNIKICTAHNGTRGCLNRSTCKDMHICAKYVRGKCDSEECVMGHYWLTRHNMGILSQLKIQNLPEESLERLLQSSFSNTGASKSEPSVCYKYNKGECQRQQCQQLHICYTYITNNLLCTKIKCKLNHSLRKLNCRRVLEAADIDINESPKDVLAALLEANPALKLRDERTKIRAGQDQGKGITSQTAQEQGSGRQDQISKTVGDKENKLNKKKKIRTFWSTQANGEVNIVEICYNSVESTCPSETSGCQRLHSLEHYHWQMSENGSNWLNLQMHQVKALERAFCDVNNDGIEMPRVDPSHQVSLLKKLGRDTWTADFTTMKIVNSSKTISFQIRRLCTETVPGKVIDAAVNVWYFLDKQQNWVEYGKVDSVGETNLVVSLASDAIEKEFLKDSTASIQFKNSKFTYTLDFKSMAQTNTQTQVTREVRRRPQIHLQEEKDQEQQKQRKLPAHWDEMKSNERVKRVVIASSGDEYKNILPLLGNISSNVTKIERVQNRFHWQAFQNKIEEMADIYGDPTKVNIRQLFHGTGHDIVPKICNENFDPKLHGQSAGQAYGQGTYFARDASLSFGYCKTDSSGLKYMFMAKVAVGSLTTGNSSMARPPINSSTGYPFDSTGDNATNPSIIVKYDKAEYFPEYILTLK
ncbi:protein mono-ADP-ribosyltransferase PARP12-like isoform X3 [Macrobrachium nipponense]